MFFFRSLLRFVSPVLVLAASSVVLPGCGGGGGGDGQDGAEAVDPGALAPASFMPGGCQSCTITIVAPNGSGDGRDMELSVACEASPGREADGSISKGYIVWKKDGEEVDRLQVTGEWQLNGIFTGRIMQDFSVGCHGIGSGGLNGFEVQGLGVSFSQRQNNADGGVLYLGGEATGGSLALKGYEAGSPIDLSGSHVDIAYQR